MSLTTTLQKFISNSESMISKLVEQIESNQVDIDFRPDAFLEERNEVYRKKIAVIQTEIKTAQDTLSIL